MSKIGMFFGTETGTTRLVAKKMQKKLGDDLCDKPVNVNRITLDDMLQYDALILGTPSYGIGEIPGLSAGCFEPNWEEFFARMTVRPDFTGKRIAFFGLGFFPDWRSRRPSTRQTSSPDQKKPRPWCRSSGVGGLKSSATGRPTATPSSTRGPWSMAVSSGWLSTRARKACLPMSASTPGWCR